MQCFWVASKSCVVDFARSSPIACIRHCFPAKANITTPINHAPPRSIPHRNCRRGANASVRRGRLLQGFAGRSRGPCRNRRKLRRDRPAFRRPRLQWNPDARIREIPVPGGPDRAGRSTYGTAWFSECGADRTRALTVRLEAKPAVEWSCTVGADGSNYYRMTCRSSNGIEAWFQRDE